MITPIITLTTDFGTAAPYAAAMKGVLLSINPDAHLIDLTHEIPPQNVVYAGFFLAGALPFFPKSAVHLVVVDPGVGTDRAILCIDLAGSRLIGPDNGFWCALSKKLDARPNVYRVDCQRWQLPMVSNTFHGRDRMAPAAARLSLGYATESLGEKTTQWCQLDDGPAKVADSEIHGKIVFIDGFGNLITNISSGDLQKIDTPFEVELAGRTVSQCAKTYGDAAPGTSIAILSSFDLLEIAICQGNAELSFSAGVGACVVVRGRKLPG
jgi:S-adenosylmethionine hydrolase